MSNTSNAKRPMQDAVAGRCNACGCRFRARQWREDISCPKCGNDSVEPVMAPGGAVDYYVAKRDDGYARPDVRFAHWAKWTGLITPNQYERAFVKQNRQIQGGQPPDAIHEIIVSENWMGREQAIGLLEFLSLPRPSDLDAEFLKALAQKDNVDLDKVRRIRRLQHRALKRCHEVPPLCQLLMEKRIITEAEMLGILKQLRQDDKGDLQLAEDMAGERRSVQRVQKLRELLRPSKNTTRYTAIVLALLLLGFGAWKWQVARGPKVTVKCRQCGETGRTNWSKTYPVKCPECGKKKAYYAMECENGHIFTVSNPFKRIIKCPKCGTSETHPIREDEIE